MGAVAFRAALWLLAVLLVQGAALPALGPGPQPDLLRVYAVLAGFFAGERVGMAVGAAGGLLADLLAGRLFGLRALLGAVAGLLGARAGRHVFRDNPVVAVALATAVVVVQDAATFLLIRLLDIPYPLAGALAGTVQGVGGYVLAGWVLYVVAARQLQPAPPVVGDIRSWPPLPARGRAAGPRMRRGRP